MSHTLYVIPVRITGKRISTLLPTFSDWSYLLKLPNTYDNYHYCLCLQLDMQADPYTNPETR